MSKDFLTGTQANSKLSGWLHRPIEVNGYVTKKNLIDSSAFLVEEPLNKYIETDFVIDDDILLVNVLDVSETCVNCATCVDTCPTGAFYMGDEHYEIDKNLCILCRACFDYCPIEAIIGKHE